MKFSSFCKSILLPLCLPYSLFIGCSVVGAVVGGLSSPGRPGRVTSSLGLDSMALGTEIQLVRFDRTSLEGTYRGIALYPGAMYARLYDTLLRRSAYRKVVPKLNQSITLSAGGMVDEGIFKGIDRGALLYQPAAGGDTLSVLVDDIGWVQTSDSSRLEGSMLLKLVRDGTMKGRSVVLLDVDKVQEYIPYETIQLVQVEGTSSGWLTGFLIGAAVDITVVAIFASAESQTSSDCNKSAQACSNPSCTVNHR